MLKRLWGKVEQIVYEIFRLIIHKKDDYESKAVLFLEFLKFSMVGFSNTVISYITYISTLLLLQTFNLFSDIDYLIAQILAFFLSVLWSFYWNNKYVFKSQEQPWWKKLIKTYISYSFTGLFLNSILLYLWVDVLNISEFIAPLINLVISVPLNFLINKFWAFAKK